MTAFTEKLSRENCCAVLVDYLTGFLPGLRSMEREQFDANVRGYCLARRSAGKLIQQLHGGRLGVWIGQPGQQRMVAGRARVGDYNSYVIAYAYWRVISRVHTGRLGQPSRPGDGQCSDGAALTVPADDGPAASGPSLKQQARGTRRRT